MTFQNMRNNQIMWNDTLVVVQAIVLEKKANETDMKCRFHFPFDNCSKTKLEFEKIHTSGDNER